MQLFVGITAVMTLVAGGAGVGVLAWPKRSLRELVVTDPLTGLPNYRRLLEVLGIEIARPTDTSGRLPWSSSTWTA